MAHIRAALQGVILDVKLYDWIENFDATLERALNHLHLALDFTKATAACAQ
jgi:hypothetical protein